MLYFQERAVWLECGGPGKQEGPQPRLFGSSSERGLAAPGDEEEVGGESPENHEVTWVFPAQVVPVLRLLDPPEWARE